MFESLDVRLTRKRRKPFYSQTKRYYSPQLYCCCLQTYCTILLLAQGQRKVLQGGQDGQSQWTGWAWSWGPPTHHMYLGGWQFQYITHVVEHGFNEVIFFPCSLYKFCSKLSFLKVVLFYEDNVKMKSRNELNITKSWQFTVPVCFTKKCNLLNCMWLNNQICLRNSMEL